MSNQTSIHFNPTALLIIKNEVDNSIQLVESAVSSLVEDQTLPFGIDDALNQFEQCAHVLALIDMPNLSTIAHDSAELMRKIMQNPSDILHQDVVALSDGTSILKRYIEFICLKEVKALPFLLPTLNRLELALGKPLTQEGCLLAQTLDPTNFELSLPEVKVQPKSAHVHRLYKLALNKIIKKQHDKSNVHALNLVGAYVADLAQTHPSEQYWNLVQIAFTELENTIWNEPRYRTLIQLERHLAEFLAEPEDFYPTFAHTTNILNLCLIQNGTVHEELRQQLGLQNNVLTETQLQTYSRHLYGPDLQTMQTISQLVTQEITHVRNEIEYNYQNMNLETLEQLQLQLKHAANIFNVLNLNKIAHNLTHQAQLLNLEVLRDENFVQQFMNCIQSAINAVAVLERQYCSNRLQFAINNTHISLDRLDEAHEVLLTETKILVDNCNNLLVKYLQQQEIKELEMVPNHLKEIAGAIQFLNGESGQTAIVTAENFVQHQLDIDGNISAEQVNIIFDALASIDMLIENLRNKQPVMQSMFDIALNSSLKLTKAA